MKVGLLVSRSGPAGLWAPSCDAGAILAAAEINTGGGIRDRSIELIVADAGCSDNEAAAASGMLVDIDAVDAIVGMHPSNVRGAIKARIAGKVPYIYTPQYEGGETSPYTVATGGIDREILDPAIGWLIDVRHARRFFLIGNDYVWPRRANHYAHALIRAAGGEVRGQAVVPFGMSDHTQVLDQIRSTRPDVVIMALLGSEAATFNRAFSEAGLASKILRLGLATDETVLYAIGSEHSENLYAALNYFSHIASRANDRFLESYHGSFGERAPPVNLFSQCCYDGVHLVANLARSLGRWDRASLARSVMRPIGRSAARRTLVKTPMGPTLRVHLAVADGIQFRNIASQ